MSEGLRAADVRPVLREQLTREARVVGLRHDDLPSLESVERRRFQLWVLSTVLLVFLALAVFMSMWTPRVVGNVVTPLVLRLSVVGLVIGFSIYSFEKELHLRRLWGLLLEERLLTTALSNRLKELTLLLEAGKAMNSVADLEQVLDVILRSSLELLEGTTGSIMLAHPDARELEVVIARGNDRAVGKRVPFGQGVAGTVADSLQPLLITGKADAERFPGLVVRAETPHSSMSVPLMHHEQLVGVLNVNAGSDHEFSEYDLRALSLFAEQASSTIAKARLLDSERQHTEMLAHLAFHDPLTGLANRAKLIDRIATALTRSERAGGSVGLLFIDLDRFKQVNDTLGHVAGDEVLMAVSSRLSPLVRATDTLCRLGGDEFVLLAEGLQGEIEAVGLADRIIDALEVPFQVRGSEVNISASVGVAMADGAGDDPEFLLRDADTAMYRAKRHGKSRHEVFNVAMRTNATVRLRLENALRHAVEYERVQLAYQPIVELEGGAVVGTEALLRLDDPDQGLLLPADFLQVAEDTGLIVPIGEWVLRESCRQAASWAEMSVHMSTPSGVAVNLSAQQVARPGFADTVEAVLQQTLLEPTRLSLELTESVLLEATGDARDQLHRIADLGVHIGIDDFGTGYSSLTYLRQFPVEFVKIDRSFVAGMLEHEEDMAIVESVIRLAKSLSLITVAEGVEQEAQADALRHLGCELAQGYLYGRPASPLALELHTSRR